MKAILHTDGGARGNPGPGGIGVVLDIDGKHLLFHRAIGHVTNNQAEYQAVLLGLEEARTAGADEVAVYLDSELVQQQLSGRYKVKNPELGQWFLRVWKVQQHFKKVTYTYIPRTQNKEADRLANKAMDEA